MKRWLLMLARAILGGLLGVFGVGGAVWAYLNRDGMAELGEGLLVFYLVLIAGPLGAIIGGTLGWKRGSRES